jgi:hypothetical protein
MSLLKLATLLLIGVFMFSKAMNHKEILSTSIVKADIYLEENAR